MNRDTSTAMWYRRIDRRCFTAAEPSETGNSQTRRASREPAAPRPAGPNGWRTLLNDTRGWMPETVADRL